MVNAWSLLDSVINGTLDEDCPVMNKTGKKVTTLGGKTNEYEHSKYYYDYDRNDANRENPFIGTGSTAFDSDIYFAGAADWDSTQEYGDFGDDTLKVEFPTGNLYAADTISFDSGTYTYSGSGLGQDRISFGDDPYPTLGTVDDVYAHHFPGTDTKPEPNLEFKVHKYEEDTGIKDLKDYISSTYSGHYTSDQNSTQTLDLIQSVGDAESFCRSNAIKYLARYDKKGQAKRDILKAMHYCLLLYYFSGQTNETPTGGYETF